MAKLKFQHNDHAAVLWKSLDPKTDTETDDVPSVKNAKVVGDMVKIEIVDAAVIPGLCTFLRIRE